MYRPKRAKDVVEAQDKPFRELPGWAAFLVFIAVCGATFYLVDSMLSLPQLRQMRKPLVSGKYVSINPWSFTHVALFFVAGFVWPDQPITIFVFGALWEAAKYGLVEHDRVYLNVWRSTEVKLFWDLWCNIAGYRIGEWVVIRVAQWRAERRKTAERKAARKAAAAKKKGT